MSWMNTTCRRIAVTLALVCLAVGQAAYYYPRLPDTVASHFGYACRPDGWMSKGGFLAIDVSVIFALSVLFLGISLAMHTLGLKRLRPEDETEESAKKILAGRRMSATMAGFMFWFGTATILLLLTIFQMAIQANLGPDPVLRHAGFALSAYVAVAVLLAARVVIQYRQFERISPSAPLPPGIWFPAKRFGWGWGLPARWQGWVFVSGWLLGLGLGTVLILRSSLPALFVPFELVMVAVLIVVCAVKGEKPRWRWGD